MDEIFRFDKVYTGTVVKDGQNFPCTLSFEDHEIIFSLVTDGSETFGKMVRDVSLGGYIATEKRVMNFRAIKCIQLSDSYTWSSYSRQRFLANGLLVCDESKDISCETFLEASLVYDKFYLIGRFLDIDRVVADRSVGETKDTFTVEPLFEDIILYDQDGRKVTLENPYRYAFSHSDRNKIKVSIEPFISYQPPKSSEITALSEYAINTGWFFQLLFGFAQSLTDVILFDTLSNGHGRRPYFYFSKALIKRKLIPNPIATPHPIFDVEELKDQLGDYYANWVGFNEKQKLVCRLFFNEVNSENVVSDDRFKNYCAIIQGLNALLGPKPKNNIKGDMNSKLHHSLDDVLKEKLLKYMSQEFLERLFLLIGEQRDHYQHLSKKLTVDLCAEAELMYSTNALLAVIIKSYLFKAVGMNKLIHSRYLDREVYLLTNSLHILKRKLAVE